MHAEPERLGRRDALRSAIVLALVCASAPFAITCAQLGSRPERALLAEARAAFERRDFETAYRRAKQLATEHPGSRDDYQAFVIAAQSLKVVYHRYRVREPDSAWITAEPAFLFAWLARYLDGASATEAANVLFVGLPYGVLRDFEAYAAARPELSPLVLRAEDDNGIVQQVTIEGFAGRS